MLRYENQFNAARSTETLASPKKETAAEAAVSVIPETCFIVLLCDGARRRVRRGPYPAKRGTPVPEP